MNEQEKHHQAEDLEKLFQEVREHEEKFHHPNSVGLLIENEIDPPKIDVLNLPPRREVHEGHEKGLKIKLSKAFWRLIIVLILLLIIIALVIYDLTLAEKKIIFNMFTHHPSKKLNLFSYIWR